MLGSGRAAAMIGAVEYFPMDVKSTIADWPANCKVNCPFGFSNCVIVDTLALLLLIQYEEYFIDGLLLFLPLPKQHPISTRPCLSILLAPAGSFPV